ncbi:MAG: YihY/virulence factor BrkB family protein [Chloroflexota bacterium]|nr:YihY/virulence factor BrkB family protein [Chloroflexota bacterium]
MRAMYAERVHQVREFTYGFPAPPVFRSVAELLFRTTRNFVLNEGSHMAAGVAYYAIFSLFPLMLATIAVTEYFIHSADLQSDVIHFVDRQFPGQDHDFVEDHLADLQAARSALGAIAMVGLIWAGRAVFGAVRRVVNRAWKIAEPPHFLIDQIAQIAASMGAVLLFISAAVAGSVGRAVASETELLPVAIPWGFFFNYLPFIVSMGLFVLVYRMLPDTDVRWRDAIVPGIIAAIALEVTKLLFSFYLANLSRLDLVYGSIATVVVTMLFLYVVSVILVWCAEFSSEIRRTDEAQMLNLRRGLRPVRGGLASVIHRPSRRHRALDEEGPHGQLFA